MILSIPDIIDKALLASSEARTKIALGQPVDPESLLTAISNLIDHAEELQGEVDYCVMYHDRDDDDDGEEP
jgi:hypothetical protein